jgi:hypothetical protein
MGRRSSNSSGFFGFGDIVFGLVAIGAGFIMALPYLQTAAYYLFPAWLLWLNHRSPQSLQIPEFYAVSNEDAQNELLAAQENRSEAEQEVESILSDGISDGVRYLDHQDRFENRSNFGQSLNRRLAEARERLEHFESVVALCEEPFQAAQLVWVKKVQAWYKQLSNRKALQAALISFAAASIFEEIRHSGQTDSSLLVFNPIPAVLRPSTVSGTNIAWVVGLVTLFGARWVYADQAEEFIRRKIDEEDADSQSQHEHYYSEDESDSTTTDEDADGGKPDSWHEILSVSPRASIDDIKRAYKESISRCHPDTVESRSKTIREAALKESQMINWAYAEARRVRNF